MDIYFILSYNPILLFILLLKLYNEQIWANERILNTIPKTAESNFFQAHVEHLSNMIMNWAVMICLTFQIIKIAENILSNFDAIELDMNYKNISRKPSYLGN